MQILVDFCSILTVILTVLWSHEIHWDFEYRRVVGDIFEEYAVGCLNKRNHVVSGFTSIRQMKVQLSNNSTNQFLNIV